MSVYDLSGKQKIEALGFNAQEFWKEVMELEDLVLLGYSKQNLEEKVYPKLRELKAKYGFDVPISVFGLDVVRLDNVLTTQLLNKQGGR